MANRTDPILGEHQFQESTYRAKIIEHKFLGKLLSECWPKRIEVARPDVDNAGYDLILGTGRIVRHVQLKSSYDTSKTRHQDVHLQLAKQPSGCVIWIVVDSSFQLKRFYWFGENPGDPLRDLSQFRPAKTKKADSKGVKKERPNLREVPKGEFEIHELEDVAQLLFG